jgi:hypothetical protein
MSSPCSMRTRLIDVINTERFVLIDFHTVAFWSWQGKLRLSATVGRSQNRAIGGLA